MKSVLSVAVVLLLLSVGCERERALDGEDTEVLTIGPYTQACQGFIEQECFLEYNEESQQWEFFYEEIQGFDFEPGFVYTLEVRREDRGTDVQDVGRYAYYLVEILSKEEAGSDD